MFSLKRKAGCMKNRSFFKLFFLFMILSLASCATFSGPKEINLTKENNGKTINAKVNDTVIITLAGNATTGYTWILKKYDEDLIKFIDVQYITSDSNLMGAGGEWIAKFQILKPGNSQIQFIYKRPWETKEDPLENYFVVINTKADNGK